MRMKTLNLSLNQTPRRKRRFSCHWWLVASLLLVVSDYQFEEVEAWASVLSIKASTVGASKRGRNQTQSTRRKNGSSLSSHTSLKQNRNKNKSRRKNSSNSATRAKPPKKYLQPRRPSQPPKSLGEAVQQAQTINDLLEIATQFWLPTDSDLATHLRTQSIHHERRQRWAAQWLQKLGDLWLIPGPVAVPVSHPKHKDNEVWSCPALGRVVLAAAIPFDNDKPVRNDKEQRAVREALLGLHTLAGQTIPVPNTNEDVVHNNVTSGLNLLLERAEVMAELLSLQEALELRWACRGLLVRLQPEVGSKRGDPILAQKLAKCLPRLERRVAGLPFDILPMGIDLGEGQGDTMNSLQQSIPFQFDTIVTRTGASVTERRGTAWVAEEGIGALAYSGKLMPPSPMPQLVRDIMRQVELSIDAPFQFDCALCNYYPGGESACKFHTDPEHGTMWERLNCVVALGNPRRFAFRPIPGVTNWQEWDKSTSSSSDGYPTRGDDSDNNVPAVVRVFPGDIVQMDATCNDDFHHAVYPEITISVELDGNDLNRLQNLKRISLVLKRAMVNGKNARRGHGLQGKGRRARRKTIS